MISSGNRPDTGTLLTGRPSTHPAPQAPTAGLPEPHRSAAGTDAATPFGDRAQWHPRHGPQPELRHKDQHEHGGTRTPDPQNRNLMLYPTELHAH